MSVAIRQMVGLIACGTVGSAALAQPEWVPVYQSPDVPVVVPGHSAWVGSPVYGTSAVYDESRGELITHHLTDDGYGRSISDGAVNAWGWDGVTWNARESIPLLHAGFSRMVYHRVRGQPMLLGGWWIESGTFGMPQTTATSRTATRASGAWDIAGMPGPLVGHAAAYDEARDETVVFGGGGGSFVVITPTPAGANDTMYIDDGRTWRTVGVPRPEPRNMHAMAYDPVREEVVLFGGIGTGRAEDPQPDGSTWAWDGTSWQIRATEGPPRLYLHAMTWDPVRGVILLTGGLDAVVGPIFGNPRQEDFEALNQDVWAWDGASWTVVDDIGSMPPRVAHAMVIDPTRNEPLVVGGSTLRLDGRLGYQFRRATTTMVLTELCSPADRNDDGVVNSADLELFVGLFLSDDVSADLNGDGVNDLGDISALVSAYLEGC